MALATERLADSDVPLYLIPGNDDEFGIDEILDRPEWAPVNVDGKVVDLPGDLQLLACGWSNHTPVADPARGVRGRALRAPRRARQAGPRSRDAPCS